MTSIFRSKKPFIFLVIISMLLITSCSVINPRPIESPSEIILPQKADVITITTSNTETVNNCDGESKSVIFTRSHNTEQTTFFNVVVEGGGLIKGEPLSSLLEIELEAELQRWLGNTTENNAGQEVSIDLLPNPGTITEYTITWNEKRIKGNIELRYPNGNAKVEFEKVTQVELANVQKSKTNTCSQITASPIPTKDAEIAVLYISSNLGSDGTVKNKAELSLSSIGLGTLQLNSPSSMILGESNIVRLVITPDSSLINLPKVTIPTINSQNNDPLLNFSDRIQIYPRMVAALEGVNFKIVSSEISEKPVLSDSPIEWVWSITPTSAGKQSLILTISIPVLIDKLQNKISSQPLKSIPIQVVINTTATPNPSVTVIPTSTSTLTLTPTVIPRTKQIEDELVKNSSGILIAFITLLGVIITAYVTYRSKKLETQKSSNAKNKKGK